MSEATPDTGTPAPEATPEATDTGTPEPSAADLAKEVEKWKAQSRKHEERAKANADAAKKVADLERQNMTELEAAVAKARDETAATVRAEMGSALAGEAIRAAATGRVADVDALLEGVNPAKFLDDAGNPDRDAIQQWIDRVAPVTEQQEAPPATLPAGYYDLGQGARSTSTAEVDPLAQALTDISRR